MIELSAQQRQQLAGGAAVDVTDPATSTPYVLMRKDVYDRVKDEAPDVVFRAVPARPLGPVPAGAVSGSPPPGASPPPSP